MCWTTGVGGKGGPVKCPGDPAPKKNPDGSDVAGLAEDLMSTFCTVGAGPPWISVPACYLFGYFESNGDPVAEGTAGAKGICDAFLEGTCTFFTEVTPLISDALSDPCDIDPESSSCVNSGPGK